jgi:phosphosulfolactate synthase
MTEQAPAQCITVRRDACGGPGLRTPGFLELPARTVKPRTAGLLHVLDDGMPAAEARQYLDAAAPLIDIWKFGWGTAYIDQQLEEKLDLLDEHGIRACTGGTLLEIAWAQGAVAQFLDWAVAVGFPCVEVSSGTVTLTRAEKSSLISVAAQRFSVLAEIGRKDAGASVRPGQWAADAEADRQAGADYVVTEGRESGTVGLYEPDGSVRADVVEAVVAAIGAERVLFEAPQRAQQTWLIRRYGANVNLGNVRPAAALSVEALRLGLRADTVNAVPASTGPATTGPASTGPDGEEA